MNVRQADEHLRERYSETAPEKSEITVNKVECYYLMNRYLKKLTNTPMKTIEDIVRFNDKNPEQKVPTQAIIPRFQTANQCSAKS